MEPNRTKNYLSLKENMERILEICASSTRRRDLREVLHKYQDCNQSKLSIGLFFEFMKLAYQFNESCESLITILTVGGELDWNKIAKIDLHVVEPNYNIAAEKRITSDDMQRNKCNYSLEDIISEKNDDDDIKNPVQYIVPSDVQSENEQVHDRNIMTTLGRCNESSAYPVHLTDVKSAGSVRDSENFLIALMKMNLSNILHEGLLDTILPYMIPKTSISQPIIKKSVTTSETRKSNSISNNIEIKAISNVAYKEKEKDKNKGSKKLNESEVEIHVCDEEKNIKKNFHCPQKLLIQKMRYFADVTAGQRLEEIDISVHCDIAIFDWLMRWVKKDIIKKSEWPVLETTNVIPILVSASFLQMEPLLESCLQYCHDNMSDILKTSTILTGLDDNLLTRLVEQFTNEDVDALKDKKDKIQSKLFCKLIMSLAEVLPDNKKGHYGSLATLFKCSRCGKNIVQSMSNYVPCISSAMRIENYGNIHSKHTRDLTWTLNDYIVTLRTELHSWRKVYWRLWGDCHFLFCTQCNIYYPIHQFGWCCYHTELPQFFINEQQRPMPYPLGRYPCCSQRAYKFEVLSNREGCRYRDHVPDIRTEKDINVLNIFTVHKEVIAMEPPQLFFPEKIIRLVACDASLQSGKLICKDLMWWLGIELVPQRPKLGLLGKIWSGSAFRRSSHVQDLQRMSHRICQQVSAIDTSVTVSSSSVTSSATESDIDDGNTTYDNSSVGEESNQSEESHTWSLLQSKSRTKKEINSQATCRNNGRSWNGSLNVRHNQDNQRDFEEGAALQMITLLTKRVCADSSLLKSSNKHNRIKKQSNGGTYARLEAELRDQINQFYKMKNITGKCILRAKLNKS